MYTNNLALPPSVAGKRTCLYECTVFWPSCCLEMTFGDPVTLANDVKFCHYMHWLRVDSKLKRHARARV